MCFEISDGHHYSPYKPRQTPKSKTWYHYINKSNFVRQVLGDKMGFTIDVRFYRPRCPPHATICPIQQTQYTIKIGGIENEEHVTEWLKTLGKYFCNKITEKNITIVNSGFFKVCGRLTQSVFHIEGTLPQPSSNLNEDTMLSQVLLVTKNNQHVAQTNLDDNFDMDNYKSHLLNIKLTHTNQELTPWIWTKRSNQSLIMPIDLKKGSSSSSSE